MFQTRDRAEQYFELIGTKETVKKDKEVMLYPDREYHVAKVCE